MPLTDMAVSQAVENCMAVDRRVTKVAALTESEIARYENIDFPLEGAKQATGVDRLLYEGNQKQTLMHMWRYPALSIHGIEGAHSGPGAKTVIPGTVIGKFSIRLVPNQEPRAIADLVAKHCQDVFNGFGSANQMEVKTDGHGAEAFGGDPEDHNYQAASRANECVWGAPPDFVRSGGSIPVTLTMQETGRSVVLFPVPQR